MLLSFFHLLSWSFHKIQGIVFLLLFTALFSWDSVYVCSPFWISPWKRKRKALTTKQAFVHLSFAVLWALFLSSAWITLFHSFLFFLPLSLKKGKYIFIITSRCSTAADCANWAVKHLSLLSCTIKSQSRSFEMCEFGSWQQLFLNSSFIVFDLFTPRLIASVVNNVDEKKMIYAVFWYDSEF